MISGLVPTTVATFMAKSGERRQGTGDRWNTGEWTTGECFQEVEIRIQGAGFEQEVTEGTEVRGAEVSGRGYWWGWFLCPIAEEFQAIVHLFGCATGNQLEQAAHLLTDTVGLLTRNNDA